MSNLDAAFKQLKMESREVETFQKNVAEKFRRLDLKPSGVDGVDGADGANGMDGADGADGSGQPMTLGTRIASQAFAQNTNLAAVSYASSQRVEVGFLPDVNGSIAINSSSTSYNVQLYRNGALINSLSVNKPSINIVPHTDFRLFDLNPIGGSVSYTLRFSLGGSGTINISNTYIYAKEV